MNTFRLSPRVGRRLVLVVLGLSPVGALLAWVYGLGRFSVWFFALSVPATAALALLGLVAPRRPALADVSEALRLGAIGGLIGTLGYDAFRIPFEQIGGFRVLAPIQAYGVLALDTSSSSRWTGFVGWSFHVVNGLGFAIAYAAVARRRHWAWAVAWALLLETATVVTPFATMFGLRGKWDVIAIAYMAHVPYGLAVGIVCRRADRWLGHLAQLGRSSVLVAVTIAFAGLFVWQRPFVSDPNIAAGQDLAPGASTVVRTKSFSPQWLRIPVGGCATVRNDDEVPYAVPKAIGSPTLAPGEPTQLCFGARGVVRVKLTTDAFSGGFVIVDPAR